MSSTSSPFVVSFVRVCIACLLTRASLESPVPQTAVLESVSKLDSAWQDLRAKLISTLQNSTSTQTPTATPSPADTDGDALVTLLQTISLALERCLNVVTLPLAGSLSGRAYLGVPDTRSCLNSTIGEGECVNNRQYCNVTSTLRDLGVDYFPRFLAENRCSGCDPEDEGCLESNQRCSIAPLMLTPKVLKRTAFGAWRLVNAPSSLVAYCDCRKS